jgi:hypothetical protein
MGHMGSYQLTVESKGRNRNVEDHRMVVMGMVELSWRMVVVATVELAIGRPMVEQQCSMVRQRHSSKPMERHSSNLMERHSSIG